MFFLSRERQKENVVDVICYQLRFPLALVITFTAHRADRAFPYAFSVASVACTVRAAAVTITYKSNDIIKTRSSLFVNIPCQTTYIQGNTVVQSSSLCTNFQNYLCVNLLPISLSGWVLQGLMANLLCFRSRDHIHMSVLNLHPVFID